MWSAISLIFLFGGIGIVLLAFGKFDYLGWHPSMPSASPPIGTPHTTPITLAQEATLKFMLIAAVLFLGQTLLGGAVAHYRADPADFYGIDLTVIFPSNLLRGWHLQLAIFWVVSSPLGAPCLSPFRLAGVIRRANAYSFTRCFGRLLWLSLAVSWASGQGSRIYSATFGSGWAIKAGNI